MARSKISGIRNVSAKETRELLKLAWVRDEALSCRSYEARLLPDARVLMLVGDGLPGTLFASRELAAEFHRRAQEEVAKGPLDLTRTLLPPVEDFLRDVETHAKLLGERIGVPEGVLDGTEESLDAVDKRVWRIARAKRMTPQLVTPLVAYIGQVMVRACEGRWTKAPTTKKVRVPVYEPLEQAAWDAGYPARVAAKAKAEADAKAGGASASAARMAGLMVWGQFIHDHPKPIRYDVTEEPISGHENEPMIRARGGGLLQPFAIVVKEFEMGNRGSLRGAVDGSLAAHRPRGKHSPET
jgi:hypothetical protein